MIASVSRRHRRAAHVIESRLCALETAPRSNALSRSSACPSPRTPEQFATSQAYQALAYGYDAVGNLLAIDNQIALPHAGANAEAGEIDQLWAKWLGPNTEYKMTRDEKVTPLAELKFTPLP